MDWLAAFGPAGMCRFMVEVVAEISSRGVFALLMP